MTCLRFDGVDDVVVFAPLSVSMSGLPNGAGTIAVLVRLDSALPTGMVAQLQNGDLNEWYHGIGVNSVGALADDDGFGASCKTDPATITGSASGADNYRILSVSWPAGGAALERFHFSATMGSAESWTHVNSIANNGGNRAGPADIEWRIAGSSDAFFKGDVAVVAAWAGQQFTDADAQLLWGGRKTSEWWYHPAGQPVFIGEFTSMTPLSIMAGAPAFESAVGATLAAPDPTGWTFDADGQILPDLGLDDRFFGSGWNR